MKKWLILFVWAASAVNAFACSPLRDATSNAVESPLVGPSYNAILKKQKQQQTISVSEQALLDEHTEDEYKYYDLRRSTRPICVHRAPDAEYTSCDLGSCQGEYYEKHVKFSKDGQGYPASAEEIANAQKDIEALKKKWSTK